MEGGGCLLFPSVPPRLLVPVQDCQAVIWKNFCLELQVQRHYSGEGW